MYHNISVTITVRIPRELKEEVKRYGIELSSVVKRALEEEVKRKRADEARAAARRLGELFSKMSEEEIVRSVSEARGER